MDRDEAVARALAVGVDTMLLPAIDSGSHAALFSLVARYPDNCLPMMGLHPTSVNGNDMYGDELDTVEHFLATPPCGRFIAVGEVGLDLYWSRDFYREQREALERQIELSLRYELPLVIHTRDAWREMREVLHCFGGRGLRGVMHAFSGTWDDYVAVKDAGDFLFGIGGVITYKKSGLVEVVARMQLEDIVLESDAPYLTPVPHRGKRNESSYIPLVARTVAEAMGADVDRVAAVTTRNAIRMFNL